MKSFKYLLIVIIILISYLNLNNAADVSIESFTTTPEKTATPLGNLCSDIKATFTLSERPADFSNVSVYVTGVASKNLKIEVDSTGKVYTLSGIQLYAGSTLTFGNFNIKLNKETISLADGVSSPTLTCTSSTTTSSSSTSFNPPNLNEDPPTKVTLISTTNSYAVAKDGVCSQISITFTLDNVADPSTLSITSESIDTTTNQVKITQPDPAEPNYVADFDVKEGSTLSDISIKYDGTPLVLSSKLTFECKKGSGSSSESSLISINIVLILSSLFLYIVLFN